MQSPLLNHLRIPSNLPMRSEPPSLSGLNIMALIPKGYPQGDSNPVLDTVYSWGPLPTQHEGSIRPCHRADILEIPNLTCKFVLHFNYPSGVIKHNHLRDNSFKALKSTYTLWFTHPSWVW